MLYIALVITMTVITTCVAVSYFYYSRRIFRKRRLMQIITPREEMRLRTLGMAGISLVTAICMSAIICVLGYV